MVFRYCQKYFCIVVAAALGFLLLRFSLPDFAYISSYATAIRQSKDLNARISAAAEKPESSWQQQDPCSGRYIYMHDLPSRFNQDLLKLNASTEDSESVMSGESWYATTQSILEMIFHSRMKQYECLTDNSSLASAIYAPFYAGLEVTRHLWGGFSSSIKDAGALDFTNWLRGKPEWARMFGWDHFFVSGRVTWDLRRPTYIGPNWGSKLMNLPQTKNMTMITVEASPYANNDFAVPYPTDFHPSNDSEVLQWQEKVRKTKRAHLLQGQHALIKAQSEANLSVNPTGDSDTRRSTFDAILTGCIPVFFHPGSAYIQYFWHLPKNYTSYSVFIPMEGIQNGTIHVEEVLHQIPQEVVTTMREKVIGLIPSIIYARHKLKTEDAFDITVKGVLKRIEDVRRQIQEGKDPRSRFPEKSTWKYYLTGKVEKHEWDSFFRSKQ
uniref:Exostosin GT47 domain-containing protein n=1 Tax=Chenopodium quinoa TaxID=63459 RepID=A0A803LI32_CHEQI